MNRIDNPNCRIVQMLTKLAIENPGTRTRYKMSAGIVYKKSLVATGVNSYKTHPLMQSPGYHSEQIYMHAEVDAIRNALRIISQDQLTKSSIYIVRVKQENSKKYKLAMAKPCSGCERIIRSFGISHVWWSTEQIRRTHNV